MEEDSNATKSFSSAGIAIEDFEIYKDSRWDPLKNHLAGAVKIPASSPTTPIPPSPSSNPDDKPWWKFW
jgi:hypothetical protein